MRILGGKSPCPYLSSLLCTSRRTSAGSSIYRTSSTFNNVIISLKLLDVISIRMKKIIKVIILSHKLEVKFTHFMITMKIHIIENHITENLIRENLFIETLIEISTWCNIIYFTQGVMIFHMNPIFLMIRDKIITIMKEEMIIHMSKEETIIMI